MILMNTLSQREVDHYNREFYLYITVQSRTAYIAKCSTMYIESMVLTFFIIRSPQIKQSGIVETKQ